MSHLVDEKVGKEKVKQNNVHYTLNIKTLPFFDSCKIFTKIKCFWIHYSLTQLTVLRNVVRFI